MGKMKRNGGRCEETTIALTPRSHSLPSTISTTTMMIEEQAYKLKESINELIQTEKTYIDRLNTIMDAFQPKLRAYLDGDTDSLIFGSIGALIKCNAAFLKTLDNDYVASLLSHLAGFEGPYSEYCNGHAQAMQALSSVTDSGFNDAMLELIKQDSRCNGLDLQSFLLEPIQRIARYPLLIKQVPAPILT